MPALRRFEAMPPAYSDCACLPVVPDNLRLAELPADACHRVDHPSCPHRCSGGRRRPHACTAFAVATRLPFSNMSLDDDNHDYEIGPAAQDRSHEPPRRRTAVTRRGGLCGRSYACHRLNHLCIVAAVGGGGLILAPRLRSRHFSRFLFVWR